MRQYIIGHRGAMGLAPENTLKSFKVGCENTNTDAIEFDVHLSKDKHIVVIHDNTLERTTTGQGWVKDHTLGELQKLDAGQGEKIPTLAEVIEILLPYNKRPIIEIKGESWEIVEETTDQVLEFINQHNLTEKISIHSFWHGAVKKVKAVNSNINTAAIMMVGITPQKTLELVREADADEASVAWDYVSEELVSLLNSEKIPLNTWTLNNRESFERMKNIGVTGLITNYPDKFHLNKKPASR